MKKANCHCQGKKNSCKGMLEAATKSDIFLYLSGQGNAIFIRENFFYYNLLALKTGVCQPCLRVHIRVAITL